MTDIPKEMYKILKFEHVLLYYINYIKNLKCSTLRNL